MIRLWDKDWNCIGIQLDPDERQALDVSLFYLAVMVGD